MTDGGQLNPNGPDHQRIAELYRHHGADLLRFLRGVLRDEGRAEEVLHDTFARAVEKLDDGVEDPRAWLFRVGFNEAIAARRRDEAGGRALDAAGRRAEWTAPSASERALRDERLGEVLAAIEELPPEQREVLGLRVHDEMTFPRIAKRLGIPLGTALTRMRLALEKLKRRVNR